MATFVTKFSYKPQMYFLMKKGKELEAYKLYGDFEAFMQGLGFKFFSCVMDKNKVIAVYTDKEGSFILVEFGKMRPIKIFEREIYVVEVKLSYYDPHSQSVGGLEEIIKGASEKVPLESLERELRDGREYFT